MRNRAASCHSRRSEGASARDRHAPAPCPPRRPARAAAPPRGRGPSGPRCPRRRSRRPRARAWAPPRSPPGPPRRVLPRRRPARRRVPRPRASARRAPAQRRARCAAPRGRCDRATLSPVPSVPRKEMPSTGALGTSTWTPSLTQQHVPASAHRARARLVARVASFFQHDHARRQLRSRMSESQRGHRSRGPSSDDDDVAYPQVRSGRGRGRLPAGRARSTPRRVSKATGRT